MIPPTEDLELRGNDPTGHGYYGAKRGRRKHRGVDVVAIPGDSIFSPIDGTVTRIGQPYSHTDEFKLVEIENDVYRVKLMYVEPIEGIVGQRVFEGDEIGYAQDISGFWNPRMKNHVHIEVYKHGLLTDPEPLIT